MIRVKQFWMGLTGEVTGGGVVLQMVGHAPCRATGFRQPLYLMRMDDPELVRLGMELEAVPHDYLTIKENGE